jgi:hypothetical protein
VHVNTELTPFVDQSKAKAGGDNVGGHKVTTTNNNYFSPALEPDVISRLALRLSDEQFKERLESLQFFFERVSHDGVDGLEAKLIAASRQSETTRAIRMKEMFVRIMTKYSYFYSAQMILAHLLAIAEDEFKSHIEPGLGSLNQQEIDDLISDKIINPIVEKAGSCPLQITRAVANGLVYWLAEQCYIRWHK